MLVFALGKISGKFLSVLRLPALRLVHHRACKPLLWRAVMPTQAPPPSSVVPPTVTRRVHHGLFIVRWPNWIRSRRTGSAELNPSRRSNRQWLSFNEAAWTHRLIPVDPVQRTVDLLHDISNRKIIHKIWKIAGILDFYKNTPKLF
jgi:hypothetical protein